MDRHRFTGDVGRLLRAGAWWLTVAPFCWAVEVPELAIGSRLALRLAGDPSLYVANELMGVVQVLRGRLRFARSLVILLRGVLLSVAILLAARLAELTLQLPVNSALPLIIVLVFGWSIHLALNHAISPFEVARLIDRKLGLNAQVATAVESTLDNRLDHPFVRMQVRRATQQVRGIDPQLAIPLVIPVRDARLLALAILLYGGTLVAGSFGHLTLPHATQPIDAALAKQSTQQARAPSPYVTVDANQVPETALAAPTSGQPGSDLASQVNDLREQYESHAITEQQYRQQLQQLQQRIQQQARSSLAAQQALNALAAALKDNSATNDISSALLSGNYPRAAQGLDKLSQQLNQLSPEARQQLAQRLQQAAAQTKQTNPNISKSASDAASALQQGNRDQASQATRALAQAVQQASNQVTTQSQLGQELQSVQNQLGSKGKNTSQPQAGPKGDQSNSGQPEQSGTGANGKPAASQNPGGTMNGQTNQDGNGSGSPQGANGASNSPTTIQQDGGNNSGGAGSGAGSPTGSGPQNSLAVQGQKLTIVGQPSGGGNATTTTGDRSVPLTSSDGSSIAGAGGSSGTGSNVPIKVHDESNVVPLERQPMVREYFSNDGQ